MRIMPPALKSMVWLKLPECFESLDVTITIINVGYVNIQKKLTWIYYFFITNIFDLSVIMVVGIL